MGLLDWFGGTAESASLPLFRHGDVLVQGIPKLPENVKARPHLILAEGEVTGHCHRIAEADSATLYVAGAELFLRVVGPKATLTHEEHGPIELPPGDYRVWRQREYEPSSLGDSFRTVRD
jgi:hypothetical protein